MRVGVSIIKQLSTAFYSRKSMVLEELISNAYDADASVVDINLAPDKITVIDDGTGMSQEELTKFFYISYTEKQNRPPKEIRDKLKRYIIGKFGIGKLSMYQLCRKFEIITWKDGNESKAYFDFDEFEKKAFVDEIELQVTSKKSDAEKHGTEVVLTNLRSSDLLGATKLRRGLARRLFLGPDFKIRVNSIAVATPKDRESWYEFEVNETVESIGPVNGAIKYLKTNLPPHRAGVYIRIKGRVINHNPRLIDYSQLSVAMLASRRIWGYLDINSMEDALQSNRSDFVSDHPKYTALRKWLKTKLNKENEKFLTVYSKAKGEQQDAAIPEIMAQSIKEEFGKLEPQIKKVGGEKKNLQKIAPEKEKVLSPKDIAKKFELVNLFQDGPEARFDKKSGKVSVNIQHPLYSKARKRKCLEYHILKSVIVAIATATSKDLKGFLEKYDALSRNAEIPDFRKKVK